MLIPFLLGGERVGYRFGDEISSMKKGGQRDPNIKKKCEDFVLCKETFTKDEDSFRL